MSSKRAPQSEALAASATEIHIRELGIGDDATAFRLLNEEWISRYFALEAKDREQLENPDKMLREGAHIYMALRQMKGVGCVALVPMQDGVYEVSKMAVAPELRGFGIGRMLMDHAIEQARTLGARFLFLGSNTKLVSAVKLYESAGFRHVPPERIPTLPYTRANVFMELDLRR